MGRDVLMDAAVEAASALDAKRVRAEEARAAVELPWVWFVRTREFDVLERYLQGDESLCRSACLVYARALRRRELGMRHPFGADGSRLVACAFYASVLPGRLAGSRLRSHHCRCGEVAANVTESIEKAWACAERVHALFVRGIERELAERAERMRVLALERREELALAEEARRAEVAAGAGVREEPAVYVGPRSPQTQPVDPASTTTRPSRRALFRMTHDLMSKQF